MGKWVFKLMSATAFKLDSKAKLTITSKVLCLLTIDTFILKKQLKLCLGSQLHQDKSRKVLTVLYSQKKHWSDCLVSPDVDSKDNPCIVICNTGKTVVSSDERNQNLRLIWINRSGKKCNATTCTSNRLFSIRHRGKIYNISKIISVQAGQTRALYYYM